jgi:hypothetical protein
MQKKYEINRFVTECEQYARKKEKDTNLSYTLSSRQGHKYRTSPTTCSFLTEPWMNASPPAMFWWTPEHAPFHIFIDQVWPTSAYILATTSSVEQTRYTKSVSRTEHLHVMQPDWLSTFLFLALSPAWLFKWLPIFHYLFPQPNWFSACLSLIFHPTWMSVCSSADLFSLFSQPDFCRYICQPVGL